MKKVYYGVVLLTMFLCGFSLCWILCRGQKEERNYSVVKDMEKLDILLLDETAEFALIDLRDKEDFEESHLKNAINIPYVEEAFLQQVKQKVVKNLPIYLMCYSGKRSSLAFNQLVESGINDVHYVAFGYDDYLNFLMPENSAEEMEIAYQDVFPDLYIDELGGNIATVFEGFEYTMVAYISNECVSCKEALADLNVLNALKDDAFQIVLLWKRDMPADLLENYNFSENSFALNGKVKLSGVTPTYFLLDKEGKAVFIEKGSCENFVNKLFEMGIYSEEKNKAAALQYLNSYMDDGKENLLFFSTEGCNACSEALSKLKTAKEFENKNMVHIYSEREEIPEQEENGILDQSRILGRILQVKGYPSLYLQSEEDGMFYLYELE